MQNYAFPGDSRCQTLREAKRLLKNMQIPIKDKNAAIKGINLAMKLLQCAN